MTGVLGWLGRLLTGLLARLVAASLLLGVVVGTPVGLWTQFGWPLPHHLPTVEELLVGLQGRVTDELLVNTLVIVCWLLWIQFTVSLLVEAVAQLRGFRAWRVPLAGPLQPLAAHLVGALLVGVLAVGQRTSAPPAPTVSISAPAPASHIQAVAVIPPEPDAAEDDQECVDVDGLPRHTVRPYQTLWGIAETRLGDGLRWREIYELNAGRLQPDGDTLTDPDLIRPDWLLLLPDDARPLPEPPGFPVPPEPQDSQPQPPGPSPPPTTQPSQQLPPTTDPTPAPAPDQAPGEGGDRVLSPTTVIAPSLALAVLVALEILRRRRRRHRSPQAPTPGIHHQHPDDTLLRRRLYGILDRAVPPEQHDQDLSPSSVIDAHVEPTGAVDDQPDPPSGLATPSVEEQMNQQLGEGPAAPQPVVVGDRDGREVAIDLHQLGILALVGPGVSRVGRAIAVNALAANPSVHAIEVLVVGDILPDIDCPGLRQFTELDQALQELDVQRLRRSRLLDTAGQVDIATLRELQPWEPLPTLLLVTPADRTQTPRIHALTAASARLGLAAVLLIHDPAEAAVLSAWVQVAPDGTVRSVTGPHHRRLAGVRLHQLGVTDAEALLGPIAAARTPEARQVPPAPMPPPAPEPRSQPPAEPTIRPPVMVTLLGAIRIQVGGQEIRTGLRRDVKPLLCYLVLHPEGATLGAVAAELWPDITTPQQERDRWWNAVKNLHREVRTRLGDDELVVIEHAGETYRLAPDIVDADVWRFQRHLAEADQASDDAARAAALARAVELYGGPLAPYEQGGWSWAEPERLGLHDQAIGALKSLAELREALGDVDGAITALSRAIELDPVAESCYQHLMELHAKQRRPDAIDRAYQRLQAALDDIGTQPDQATIEIVARLRDMLSQMDRLRHADPPEPPPPSDAPDEYDHGDIDDAHEP